MPVDLIGISGQIFTRISSERVPRSDGRFSLYGVWSANCKVCGRPFLQRSARVPRDPSRNLNRNCSACVLAKRKQRISGKLSSNAPKPRGQSTSARTLPAEWRGARPFRGRPGPGPEKPLEPCPEPTAPAADFWWDLQSPGGSDPSQPQRQTQPAAKPSAGPQGSPAVLHKPIKGGFVDR